MSDDELILMYREYKKKRMIIIFVIIFLTILSLLIVLKFPKINNNENLKDSPEIKEEVLDNVPPELILTVSSIDILQGDEIDYLSYIESAIDNKDGDLKDKVEFTEVDTSVLGEQKIMYFVSDSSNNATQKELVVNVNAPNPEDDIPLESQPSNDNKQSSNKQSSQSNQGNKNNSNNDKKESTTNSASNNESKPTTNEKIVKYFLFSDGYTMMNVTDACAAELKKYNRTGMCSPIQDENGIYLGMKLEVQ